MLILFSHLRLDLPTGFFPSGFLTKPYVRLSPPPHTLRATPTSFFSTDNPKKFGDKDH
jgi:hypothetical protein